MSRRKGGSRSPRLGKAHFTVEQEQQVQREALEMAVTFLEDALEYRFGKGQKSFFFIFLFYPTWYLCIMPQ